MAPHKGLYGFPLHEIALCVAVAGIVIGVLAERLDTLLELSEKSAVETEIMNMRSGLRLEKAWRIATGQNLQNLVGYNPRDFLAPLSGGQTSGKLLDLPKTLVSSGWYYESKPSVLVYRPTRSRHLKLSQAGGDKRLVWKIMARSAGATDVDIVAITPYQWF